ncbi:unnamed protein product [Gongylonema pulchrum]|uniref:Pre-mRNA-splicing factor SYF2 n=1 Tax=Gongylonema pulchrum TaxID=637853 RepID=A0A183EF18_9BILA|nr:unnamed protein product [Gongylonema pulchrum]
MSMNVFFLESMSGGSVFGRLEAMGSEFGVAAADDDEITRKRNAIIDRIAAIDKEKKYVDNQIAILQRQKEKHEKELERSSDNGDNDKENNDDTGEDMASMSLVERIYAENRKKAALAEADMPAKHAPSNAIVPQYRNPWDFPLVQQTMERYKMVKPYLVKLLTERRKSDLLAQKYQTEKYNMLYAEWLKKDEKYCKSQKKLLRDEKHREIFEKTFPDLKKAREERERIERVGLTAAEQLEQVNFIK